MTCHRFGVAESSRYASSPPPGDRYESLVMFRISRSRLASPGARRVGFVPAGWGSARRCATTSSTVANRFAPAGAAASGRGSSAITRFAAPTRPGCAWVMGATSAPGAGAMPRVDAVLGRDAGVPATRCRAVSALYTSTASRIAAMYVPRCAAGTIDAKVIPSGSPTFTPRTWIRPCCRSARSRTVSNVSFVRRRTIGPYVARTGPNAVRAAVTIASRRAPVASARMFSSVLTSRHGFAPSRSSMATTRA